MNSEKIVYCDIIKEYNIMIIIKITIMDDFVATKITQHTLQNHGHIATYTIVFHLKIIY